MVDAFATVALETLRDLLIEEAKFLSNVGGRVEEVRSQLETMHAFLKDADKRRDSNNLATVKDWVDKLHRLSIDAENVLEKYGIQVQSRRQGKDLKDKLKRFTCILGECVNVHQIGHQIEDIRSRMADLSMGARSMISGSSSNSGDHDAERSRPKTYGYETEQYFVGMKDDIQRLESWLTSDDMSNRVISICGMGGLGKTTLATKIYRGEVARRSFDVRAWVCISQEFQLKNVLQELLKQFLPDEEQQIRGMETDELERKLLGVQDGKKCLVVVDDIWEHRHWNTLRGFFRTAEDRCRILLTTRTKTIAKEYRVHELKGLSEDEGWELLQKKALPLEHLQELSSIEVTLLEGYGREMIKNCGYLPLSISVLGGILRHEKNPSEWKKVCKNTDSYLQHGDGVQPNESVTQILDWSYNVLPYNLKPCFLYLGCFPEDTEIPTEDLYLFWMAEGMISSQDRGRQETLRDVAERYLCELASRCMVQLTMDEESIYNRFKSCRLHDLMRELCLLKGKKERFLEVVDTDQMGREDVFSVSRLVIHVDKPQDNISEYKHLRSLMFPKKRYYPFRELNSLVSVNFGMFKSLKILTLESFEYGKLPKGIEKLMLLKHLSVKGSGVGKLPSGICKLPCLQSLDLRTRYRIKLPNCIHKLRSLRHLFLNPYDRKVIGRGKLKLGRLIELETLIGFNSELDDAADLIELPKLRVLDGVVHNVYNLSVIVDHILKNQVRFRETRLSISGRDGFSMDLLRKTLMCGSLSSLNIWGPRLNKLPSYEPELGKNLIRLELMYSFISEDPMEMLEKLPMLRFLHLLDDSFTGKEMVCGANGFPQLRDLRMWRLPNLVEWRVEEKAMPNLSNLPIYGCRQLKMIPEGLKFITTLKQLKIMGMPKEFEERVRVVEGKEGEDYHKIKHIPSIQIGKW